MLLVLYVFLAYKYFSLTLFISSCLFENEVQGLPFDSLYSLKILKAERGTQTTSASAGRFNVLYEINLVDVGARFSVLLR